MAGQGDEEHVVARAGQRPHAVEAEPFVAARLDRRPVRDSGELDGPVAQALFPCRVLRRPQFGAEHMHRRRREIRQAAGVIEVEMGRDDVAHVAHPEAEVGDLPQRRLGDPEPRPGRRPEQPAEPPRIGDVLDPEPAVDEDEPVVAFDEKAVAAHLAADQPRSDRTHRAAIEMVNPH